MDDDERKARVMAALNKHAARDLKEIERMSGRGRKNKKPEKIIEKNCTEWMRAQGWQIQIYDSKAVFDPRVGEWRNSGIKAGNPDCMGLLPDGISVSVEFKAPGKLATFNRENNYRQQEFIRGRIEFNAFACVVDSLDRLMHIYRTWDRLRRTDVDKARDFLVSMLP